MTIWATVLIVIAMLAAVFFVGADDVLTKQKLGRLFAGRKPSSDDEFYSRFFSNSVIPLNVVSKVREIFQEQVPFDLSVLEADDDLSGDFRAIWDLDSLADVEIVIALEEQFDIKITDDEATSMKTFRNVVDFVWSKKS